jgi:putative endonuclease
LWCVYFLELSNGDIYVGFTDDLRRRVASHQSGHVVSTSKYLPLVLRSYVAVENEVTARRLERYFKSGSGKSGSGMAFAKKRFLGAAAGVATSSRIATVTHPFLTGVDRTEIIGRMNASDEQRKPITCLLLLAVQVSGAIRSEFSA